MIVKYYVLFLKKDIDNKIGGILVIIIDFVILRVGGYNELKIVKL